MGHKVIQAMMIILIMRECGYADHADRADCTDNSDHTDNADNIYLADCTDNSDITDHTDNADRADFTDNLNLDHYCPTKTLKTTNLDGKICSVAVKQASRRKNREYAKHGNSDKYKSLKKEVKDKLKDATQKFLEKQINLVSSKNTSWLKHVKHLAARPGDQ